MTKLWDMLGDPPAEYRSVPFWSWNDRLEKEELERQIEEMHRAGAGGFFMHARSGLKTPYMGPEWMEAVRVSLEAGRRLGMQAWLYDENGWPSGFADGEIPAKGPEYQQKRLVCEQAPFHGTKEQTIGWYAFEEQGRSYRLLAPGEEGAASLRISYELNPYYTDTLSRKAVGAFIDAAYERYWNTFGEQYGTELQGVFTDEPQFARGGLPWSFELEEAFAARRGYDVKEILPSLFLETGGSSKARYDYWETVTYMFTQAYARQIGEWCAGKGWSATGHVVDEQELMHQVTSVGDPMAFYEYQQIPGCDWLGRFTGSDPLVPKQVSSVARQLGRKRTITESFGCSGWNVSLAELKRIGEWQFVHGINLLCQHLQSYSLRGLRKRDYPPSLFYQQPWWGDYKAFNDYFARLSMLLSEGKGRAEVLLIHPVRTAWTLQCGGDSSAVIPYHESFAELTRWLCRSLIEHDYGSESIIARHGRVSEGRFIVGEAAYRVVIIPPCLTLDQTTVELLEQFTAEGGRLIAFEAFPVLTGGEEDGRLAELRRAAVMPGWSCSAVSESVSAVCAPTIRLMDEAGGAIAADELNLRTLELEGSLLYYLVNSGTEAFTGLTAELSGQGPVSQIDLETGKIRHLPQDASADGVRLLLSLQAGQSLMLKQDLREAPATAEDRYGGADQLPVVNSCALSAPSAEDRHFRELDPVWQISRIDLNSLTLDNARVRIDGGAWSGPQPVIFIQEQLLALGRSVLIELAFEFDVAFDVRRRRELYLVLEQPEAFEISLNGTPVFSADCGWWRDISMRRLDIQGMAVSGRNTVILKTEFRHSADLQAKLERAQQFEAEGNKLTLEQEMESIYLLGSFGVESAGSYEDTERRTVWTEGPFVLTEAPEQVSAGDLTRQGFPFFAGSIHLNQTFDIDMENISSAKWSFRNVPDAIVSELLINGTKVQTFMWEPYETDITPYLVPGCNDIELILTGSCRNLLGPHHHIKGEVFKVGPDSFKDKPGWTDKDLPPDTHVYQERYAFVRFGLSACPQIIIE